jgi:exonuclease III
MRIISYNVNGIRAAIKKGFFDWLKTNPADVICLQETKAHEVGEAKMPAKKKKKEEKKQEMPAIVAKAEKREKLVVKREKEKRVESAEAKGKKKMTPLM